MFGIGGTELFIILLFGFLIFGPDKLPQMGRTIGRAMRQFRNAQDEMNKVIREEVYDPTKDKEPINNMFDGVFDNAFGSDSKKEAASKEAAVVAASKATKEDGNQETFAERKARLAKEREEKRASNEAKAASADKPADAAAAEKPSDAAAAAKPADGAAAGKPSEPAADKAAAKPAADVEKVEPKRTTSSGIVKPVMPKTAGTPASTAKAPSESAAKPAADPASKPAADSAAKPAASDTPSDDGKGVGAGA